MPHTNRKKKSAGSAPKQSEDRKSVIVHTKRKEVEDGDGWTHIVDTPRTRSSTLKSKSKSPLLHGGDFEINGVSYINRTLEELTADYEYWRKGWEESDACKELTEKINTGKEGKRVVENVVCLGLGSLQSSRREGRRSSATQLAALQTIKNTLGGELKVVAQDPQFTELDKEFLVGLGFSVVDDPEGFTKIGEGSLVYAIHCYAKVYKAASDAPRPALLIGTDVGNFGRFDTSETIENVANSLEDMVASCEQLDFPQIRHDFSDTKIYWRKTSQPVTVEMNAQPSDAYPVAVSQQEEADKSKISQPEVAQIEALAPEITETETAELTIPQPETIETTTAEPVEVEAQTAETAVS